MDNAKSAFSSAIDNTDITDRELGRRSGPIGKGTPAARFGRDRTVCASPSSPRVPAKVASPCDLRTFIRACRSGAVARLAVPRGSAAPAAPVRRPQAKLCRERNFCRGAAGGCGTDFRSCRVPSPPCTGIPRRISCPGRRLIIMTHRLETAVSADQVAQEVRVLARVEDVFRRRGSIRGPLIG